MRRYLTYDTLIISILCITLDMFAGAFPMEIFRFPVNILASILWFVATLEIYRRREGSSFSRYMLSMRATILSIALLATIGIVLGLKSKADGASYTIVVALLFVLTHLALITLRGCRNNRGIRWRFLANHLGLMIALGAALWGAPDREALRSVVTKDRATNEAYNDEGEIKLLDFEMQLVGFDAEFYDNGRPESYEATIAIDGKEHRIRVNKPYMRTPAESIYLISYDMEQPSDARYCIVESVREPWRWAIAVGIGLLIVGAAMMFLQGPKTEKR